MPLDYLLRLLNDPSASQQRRDRAARTALPPADRTEGIEPEAVIFLRRMGANFLTSASVFRLWSLSLFDQERARGYVGRLHAQDGGIFVLPPL
jgi:hypothetical protein